MKDRVLTYISITIGSLALLLVIIVFIVVLVTRPEEARPLEIDTGEQRTRNENMGPNRIIIEEGPPPLSNNNNRAPPQAVPIEGKISGRQAFEDIAFLFRPSVDNMEISNSDMSYNETHKIIVSDDQIAKEPRRITTNEILLKHLVIAGCDVILPDPSEFKGMDVGEIIYFVLLNSSEDDEIELGYTSFWTSKAETTCVGPRSGNHFILRNIGNNNGEVYRLSS
jgi:hypothetical protein